MPALADLALAVMRLDGKQDAAPGHLQHPRRRGYDAADWARRQMPDVHLAADRRPPHRQAPCDRRARGFLHKHDHHRGGVDRRHPGDMTTDRELKRHRLLQRGRHAHLDVLQRVPVGGGLGHRRFPDDAEGALTAAFVTTNV